MIDTDRSSDRKRRSAVLLIAVVSVLFAACAKKEDPKPPPPAPVSQSIDELVLMPLFPGGMRALIAYLDEHIEYPYEALQERRDGTVRISFVVGKDGSVSDVEVVEGVSEDLDEAAIKAMEGMPKWLPGMMGGRAVSVKYQIPVVFTLPEV